MNMVWDLSEASKKEADRLETQLQEYLDKKASFDDQISSRHARISKLSKEIENLEKQNVELEWENHCPLEILLIKKLPEASNTVKLLFNWEWGWYLRRS